MPSGLPPAQALYIGMEVIIAVSSVIGNVMVVWAVRINRSLRDTTFCFIVSLALADIAVGALVIPLAITISIGLKTHFYSCLLVACTVLVLTQSSILALLAIAIDRYLRVKIPMSYKRVVTPRRAGTAVVVCWMVAIVVGLTPMLGWNNLQRLRDNGSLVTPDLLVTCQFETVISMDYMVYFNFFGWVLPPLILMLLIYAEIFYMIHRQLNKKVTASHTDPSRYYGKELKLAKSLALVLFLFAISWLPLHILNCITLFCPDCKKPIFLIYIAILLTHGNSAVNPIVYAFRIKKFRNAFRKIWEQYVLCRDPVGKLPQRGSQRGQSGVERRLRANDDDDDV
ncbi:adenosine receptor A1-like [Oncorhynchus nerka]|uniref:Adenosine receptor A1 n=1 Tax=Oncorhynchus kisutch TaxID=8019 RepID=A0A8C7IB56_ONCKI|nr:adenosine receptor A1 [Oncorhynchus kisutch]XP_029500473.1 adenosine receptor A1-like [Oncorhynchus nerka]XP_035616717.1 adenosine receptor A1-like [Oncorhynchus keta]XP_046165763.1 adenosine receptor A1-like [Oncorhynchus gorbuscha]